MLSLETEDKCLALQYSLHILQTLLGFTQPCCPWLKKNRDGFLWYSVILTDLLGNPFQLHHLLARPSQETAHRA